MKTTTYLELLRIVVPISGSPSIDKLFKKCCDDSLKQNPEPKKQPYDKIRYLRKLVRTRNALFYERAKKLTVRQVGHNLYVGKNWYASPAAFLNIVKS